MAILKHQQQSIRLSAHLNKLGFSEEILKKIGILLVAWTMFETALEAALWALHEENVAGVRPSTDKMSIDKWIKAMRKQSRRLSVENQKLLHDAAIAAEDILEYRHAIIHGQIIPYSSGPCFIRNPGWHGEQRERPRSEAHVDANLLDMAIDTVSVLHQVCVRAKAVCEDPNKSKDFLSLKPDVHRIASQANELRHLATLMNHEKW